MYEIRDTMNQDHIRLDALYLEYCSLRADNPVAARELWQDFEEGLRHHMTMEEELLFPVFETRTRMAEHGPTVVMRQQHGEIRGMLAALSLRRGESRGGTDLEDALFLLLRSHDAMEEFIFTPWFDEILSEGERMVLHEHIRVFDLPPVELYGHG